MASLGRLVIHSSNVGLQIRQVLILEKELR
jgi:hypothetical protein